MNVALEVYAAGVVVMVLPFTQYLRRAGGQLAEQVIGGVIAAATWPLALPVVVRGTIRRSHIAEVRQLHPAGSSGLGARATSPAVRVAGVR